jgi:hypothetical protein
MSNNQKVFLAMFFGSFAGTVAGWIGIVIMYQLITAIYFFSFMQ